jgi:hypothetical protein
VRFLFPSTQEFLFMISISRTPIREFRAMCRKAFGVGGSRALVVQVQAQRDQLTLRAVNVDVALEYRVPHAGAPIEFYCQIDLLDACQGTSGSDPVQFEMLAGNMLRASWQERGIPWQREAEALPAERMGQFPALPANQASNPPELLVALVAASACVERQSGRYALGCLQLDGQQGRILSTDGRQALVQSGFRFTWSEPKLIPANPALCAKQLPSNEPILVGNHKSWVMLTIGPWTLWFKEHEGRFPEIDRSLRQLDGEPGRLTLDPRDTQFALSAIGSLPGRNLPHEPITLELNGEVLLRAYDADSGPIAELLLAHSRYSGPPATVRTNRQMLARVLQLDLNEIGLQTPEEPLQAYGKNRHYVWVPLTGDAPQITGRTIRRIASDGSAVAVASSRIPEPVMVPATVAETSVAALPQPAVVTPTAVASPQAATPILPSAEEVTTTTPLAQAVEMRARLREALNDMNALVKSLRQTRRQPKRGAA